MTQECAHHHRQLSIVIVVTVFSLFAVGICMHISTVFVCMCGCMHVCVCGVHAYVCLSNVYVCECD